MKKLKMELLIVKAYDITVHVVDNTVVVNYSDYTGTRDAIELQGFDNETVAVREAIRVATYLEAEYEGISSELYV